MTLIENPTPPQISIVIPTRNNETDLINCANSIARLDYPSISINVVIWDNNSGDESKKAFKNYLNSLKKNNRVKMTILERKANYGVYTSRDELFKRIKEDTHFVLSIDDDVVLPSDILSKLIPLFQKDESLGIIGPRIVYDDAPNETAYAAGFVDWWLGRYILKDFKSPSECDYVIGCCMLIRKKVIDVIGGFDRDYFTSHGEVDFCLRAKRAAYKVLYHPGVRVRHRVERGGTRTLNRLYYIYRNKLLVIRKNSPIPQKWFSLPLYLIFWLPKSILDSIIINRRLNFPEVKMIFRAIFDGWLGKTGKRI